MIFSELLLVSTLHPASSVPCAKARDADDPVPYVVRIKFVNQNQVRESESSS